MVKEQKKEKKVEKKAYVYAVGRQKSAVARIRLYTNVPEGLLWGEQMVSKEQILVNEKPIEHYFPGPLAKASYIQPFTLSNTVGMFAITAKITGGGQNSQLDAFIKGVARALVASDSKAYRILLKKEKMLTRDSRVRERRKIGTGGKARRQKQSPKR